MSYIEINNADKTFASKVGIKQQVLSKVSLNIEKGEFICLLGPSGCGKTTLLNSLAGFERPDSGDITIDGKKMVSPSNRYVTIFQNYGLLPWKNVEKNVMLGLTGAKRDKAHIKELVERYISLVGLDGFEKRRPGQLSGGQQQRVSIARALAVEPEILFMDEPFSALDALIRFKLQEDIRRIATEQKITVVFVTHDIEEAVYLGDRIVIMTPNPGKIKSIIRVDHSMKRDRTSDEFLKIRDKVFETFEMKQKDNTEYYI